MRLVLSARTLGGALAASGAVVAGIALATPAHATTLVAPGGAVPVSVSGFAPETRVVLQLAGVIGSTTTHADGRGKVRTSYPAPQSAGDYRLLVSGRAAGAADEPPGDVLVGVPQVVELDFEVAGSTSSGSSGPAGSPTSGAATSGYDGGSQGPPSLGVSGVTATAAGTSDSLGVAGVSTARDARPHGAGTLSDTGQDLRRELLFGAGALLLGAALTVVGRRRRRH